MKVLRISPVQPDTDKRQYYYFKKVGKKVVEQEASFAECLARAFVQAKNINENDKRRQI